MDVSVVVPTYNRSDLLPATMAAILGQTLAPREVIVVDDGSNDDTEMALAPFLPSVRVIRIENSGSLVARNIGVRAARGDFVAFCDSDDLWRPNFLARMADLWRLEPSTTAAYSDFMVVRNEQWERTTKFSQAPAAYWQGMRAVGPGLKVFDLPIVDRIIEFQPFFPSCLVVERAAFLAIGGWDEGVGRVVGDDLATVLRLAEMPPLGVVCEPLVGIRKHASNFSGDVQAMNLGDSIVLEYALANRPSLASYAALIKASAARRRRAALDTAFANRKFACVGEIFGLLPVHELSVLTVLKRVVAGLPDPVRSNLAELLLGTGSFRARFSGSGMARGKIPDCTER